jgi:peroxiredoxin
LRDRNIGVAVILGQRCAGIAESMKKSSAQLPFPILCDENRAVIKEYGVWHPIGIDAFNMARPASFLIDGLTRTIRFMFVGSRQFERADLASILGVADKG